MTDEKAQEPKSATVPGFALGKVAEDLRPNVRSWLTLLASDARRRESGGTRHGTVVNYLSAVVTFCEWLAAQDPAPGLDEMTPPMAYRFADWMQVERGYKAPTVQLKVSALCSFWNYLARRGAVAQNPWMVVKVPSALRGPPKYLTEAQDEAMLSNARLQRDGDFFSALLIMRFAGLRISEAFALRPEDVELRPGDPTKNVQDLLRVHVVRGKGGKERTSFMIGYPNDRGIDPGTYQGIVLKFASSRAGNARLFPRGQSAFVDWYERRRADGDLPPDFRPHRLRHTFGDRLRKTPYQLEVVQVLMGHESPKTTMIYARLDEVELETRVLEQGKAASDAKEGPGVQ